MEDTTLYYTLGEASELWTDVFAPAQADERSFSIAMTRSLTPGPAGASLSTRPSSRMQ